MRPSALLVVPLLAFAGCVAPPTEPVPADTPLDVASGVWAKIQALMGDVPCEAEVGAGTSANLLQLNALSFGEESGSHGEIDVKGNLALVARNGMGGFEVVDISDPTELKLLSVYENEEANALDVKWMPSGDAAIIGSGGTVHLVDMRDPTTPTLAFTFDESAEGLEAYQSHMVLPWRYEDGSEYVYIATQTGNAPMYVLKREDWTLTYAGKYEFAPPMPLASDPALGQHDMTIYHDEILGAPVMYVAEGLLGWSAADLSDPANPKRIGGSLGLEPGIGYAHTVRVDHIDGKRIVATMQEVGMNTLKIYDATDLRAPILLARWNADPTTPHAPQHNIQLKGEMLYLAHYTHGVYVFNVSSVVRGPPALGSAELSPVAHFAVEDPQSGGALGFANVWDVVVKDGVIYVNDITSGLTSVGFGCLLPGDPLATATD